MSDEIDKLTKAVGGALKVQRIHQRRIENVEQATLAMTEVVLRLDERVDTFGDWRREADEHRRNTESAFDAIRELLLDSARQGGENRRDIAELRAATDANTEAIANLTAAVSKLVKRNGNGA